MNYLVIATLLVAQMMLSGMAWAVDRSADKEQKDYPVNILSDGSKEIIVSGAFAVGHGNKVQVLDLRSKLDAAAARECPDGYTLESDGSVGTRTSARNDGLTMTQRGVVVCNGDGRKDLSAPAKAERSAIWAYAFIARTDEPVAGHGAAIFKADGAGWIGPMWSQERLPYEMRFTISGETADATLWPKKKHDLAIQVAGSVTKQRDDNGCLTRLVLEGQNHFVVLEKASGSECN